jgi:hypothetical protein
VVRTESFSPKHRRDPPVPIPTVVARSFVMISSALCRLRLIGPTPFCLRPGPPYSLITDGLVLGGAGQRPKLPARSSSTVNWNVSAIDIDGHGSSQLGFYNDPNCDRIPS